MGKRVKDIAYWFLIVTIIIIIAVPFYLTRSPAACASCHSMKKYYSSWKESTHVVAASNCTYCHVKSGPVNALLYRIFFWREIYAEFTGKDLKPFLVSQPTTGSCVKVGCHSLNREYSRNQTIKINHRFHVSNAKLDCPICHPGTVHTGITGSPIPNRKLCFRCHETQSSNCSFCHTRQFPESQTFVH
jgi:hypothetical protein